MRPNIDVLLEILDSATRTKTGVVGAILETSQWVDDNFVAINLQHAADEYEKGSMEWIGFIEQAQMSAGGRDEEWVEVLMEFMYLVENG